MKKVKFRKFIVMSIFFIFYSFSFGKTFEMYPTKNIHNQLQLNTKTGEVKQIQDDGQKWIICNGIEKSGEKENRFSLHETQNMWNFLLLDNYTGKVWQVQFSVDGEEYMFSFPVNSIELAIPSKNSNWQDRFELHGTQNIWNFILLDSYTGRLWQLQYTVDKDSIRGLFIINEKDLADEKEKNLFYISPLTSMYQYYLINDITGEMWKFQWNTKGSDYRWIEKVE